MTKRIKAALFSVMVFLTYVNAAFATSAVYVADQTPYAGDWYEPRACMRIDDKGVDECVVLLYRIGWTLMDMQQYRPAIVRFSQALRLHENGPSFINRGLCYFHLGNLTRARSDFARAAALEPAMHEPWYNLAFIDFEQKRYRSALTHINTSINLRPTEAVSYELRARVYKKLGLRDRARENARIAHSIRMQEMVRVEIRDHAGFLEDPVK